MSTLPTYFTNVSVSAQVRYGQVRRLIVALEAPNNYTPVGIASEIGRTEDGLAAWSLFVRDVSVPGLRIIVDGQFVAI